MVGKFRATYNNQAISVCKLLGRDNSVSNKLIRVSSIIGSRTAMVGNDMSQDDLYDTIIYWLINRVSVFENYALLLSYVQYGRRRWVFWGRGVFPKIPFEWDTMTNFHDMIYLVSERWQKWLLHPWLEFTKADKLFRTLGAAPFEFLKFERTHIYALYIVFSIGNFPAIDELLPN